MKRKTSWNGIELAAETDEERKILEDLMWCMSLEPESAYELSGEGDFEVLYEEYDTFGFTTEEIKQAKLVLRLNR